MNIKHQNITLNLNSNQRTDTLIYIHQEDVNSRYIDISFVADNETVPLTDCDVYCTVLSAYDKKLLVSDIKATVSENIATIAINPTEIYPNKVYCEVCIREQNSTTQVYSPAMFSISVEPLASRNSTVTENSIGTVAEICKEVVNARDTYANLNERLNDIISSSITSCEIDVNGDLIITYSTGSTQNVGHVVGAKGDKGDIGEKGADGLNGKDGLNGLNGQDGVDGKDYVLTEEDKQYIAGLVNVPSKTSQLDNDSSFTTTSDVSTAINNVVGDINTLLTALNSGSGV